VTYDAPLLASPLADANWSAVLWTGTKHVLATGTPPALAAGNQTTVNLSLGLMPVAGPPRVTYAATPPDVIGANGAPVAPFADFPIT
jgi:hypothetical protein